MKKMLTDEEKAMLIEAAITESTTPCTTCSKSWGECKRDECAEYTKFTYENKDKLSKVTALIHEPYVFNFYMALQSYVLHLTHLKKVHNDVRQARSTALMNFSNEISTDELDVVMRRIMKLD